MDVIFVQFKPSNNTDISDSFWELLEFEASTVWVSEDVPI